jgi:omega-6 fatty acid desaturase (delta-12 desaturase)
MPLVSTGIPSYNLRKAHNALKAAWGDHIHETAFSWELLKDVITRCHLYDESEIYIPFSEAAVNKKSN